MKNYQTVSQSGGAVLLKNFAYLAGSSLTLVDQAKGWTCLQMKQILLNC